MCYHDHFEGIRYLPICPDNDDECGFEAVSPDLLGGAVRCGAVLVIIHLRP